MIALPDGWTVEMPEWAPGRVFICAADRRGWVTVDYLARGYRRGLDVSGMVHSGDRDAGSVRISRRGTYAGRGWRERLETDAVAWLRRALEGRG